MRVQLPLIALLLLGCGRTSPVREGPAPSCSNGAQDSLESDVDCGGECDACPAGAICTSWTDCLSGLCANGTCAASTPVQSVCAECPDGSCDAGVCVPESAQSRCDDGVANGSETDVDCGGECPPCRAEQSCVSYLDCESGICATGTCASASSCADGIRNGAESDVDCGGGCARCVDRRGCGADQDCISGVCEGGLCTVPTPDCNDGVRNGVETDVDCGGAQCAPCAAGSSCVSGSDCTSNLCSGLVLWSDSSWKQSQLAGTNWWAPGYDDSQWSAAFRQSAYGQPVWNNGAPMPPATPAWWIWYFDSRYTSVASTVYFRRRFTAPNTRTLTLTITADDEFDLYVDGVFLGSGNWWFTPRTFQLPVTPFSSRMLAIRVKNTGGGTSQPPGPAGLLVDLRGSSTWCR